MRTALNGLFLDAPATGTGLYLRELVRALTALAPSDEFALLAPKPDPTAPALVQVHPTRFRRANLAKLEFEQLTFPRAAARGNFDLAHVPHFGPPFWSARPVVVTIHDLIPLVLPAYRGSLRVRLYTALAGMGARRARAVLADSQASAADIQVRLGIPRERIHTVYLAADPRFAPVTDAAELARVRAKLNLPDKFVLYLGGFDVRKNVPALIEAYAGLDAQTLAATKLVLAGAPPEQESSFFPDPRVTAERLGIRNRVILPGLVAEADKPALYSAAELFCYPSVYEGFGLPPLEAMACGTPVIASRAASLPEVVGEGGVLVEPNDRAAWTRAMQELLNDAERPAELRRAGLAQAQLFSWERAARETLAVYRSVV